MNEKQEELLEEWLIKVERIPALVKRFGISTMQGSMHKAFNLSFGGTVPQPVAICLLHSLPEWYTHSPTRVGKITHFRQFFNHPGLLMYDVEKWIDDSLVICAYGITEDELDEALKPKPVVQWYDEDDMAMYGNAWMAGIY